MQIHQIAVQNPAKPKKRIGRGGKRGTYSGRGGKGQTARSGRNFRPIVREVLKRYPKLRGYKNVAARSNVQIVNIKTLESRFEKGETISPRTLVEKHIVGRISGRYSQIKILSTGELSKNLIIENCEVSKSAKAKIEKAGGSIK